MASRSRSRSCCIDPDEVQAYVDGESAELTPTEFRLLYALALEHGRVITRDELLQKLWGRRRVAPRPHGRRLRPPAAREDRPPRAAAHVHPDALRRRLQARGRAEVVTSSIPLGRIAGIRVGVNWSWLVVFALIAWTLASAVLPDQNPGRSKAAYVAMALVASFLFYASLLAHELGHALQARRDGMEIEGITLWLFGGVAKFKGQFPSAGAEFRIAVAGPLVSLALGLLFSLVPAAVSLPEVGRRRRRVARLHQPHAARLQPAARAAARRWPDPPLDPLAGARRLRERDPDQRGDRPRDRVRADRGRHLHARLPRPVQRRLARVRRLVPAAGGRGGVALPRDAGGARRRPRRRPDGARPRRRPVGPDARRVHGRGRVGGALHDLPGRRRGGASRSGCSRSAAWRRCRGPSGTGGTCATASSRSSRCRTSRRTSRSPTRCPTSRSPTSGAASSSTTAGSSGCSRSRT